jgi:hypothetical protein
MGTTTTLAVELLIIGYQAIAWLALVVCLLHGSNESMFSSIKDWKELLLVVSVPTAYTAGAVMNGITSRLVSKFDDKLIYTRSIKPSAMRAAILVRNPQAFEHVIKNFNEPRVLRSTIFNIFLIGVFGTIYMSKSPTFTNVQLGLTAVLFFSATCLAAWAWYESAENFYVHLSQTYDALDKNKGEA